MALFTPYAAFDPVSAKSPGPDLQRVGVRMKLDRSLIVGVVYEVGQGAPIVKWGFRVLDQIAARANAGMAIGLWILRRVNYSDTRPVTATWPDDVGARAMAGFVFSTLRKLDVTQTAQQNATTDPATGLPVQTTDPRTFHVAAFGSRGPEGDEPGTPGLGHESGPRKGTSGLPQISNVTIHLTMEDLEVAGACRATKTGATSRDWANVIVALMREPDLEPFNDPPKKSGCRWKPGANPDKEGLLRVRPSNFDPHANEAYPAPTVDVSKLEFP